jgi:hypothetical protein
LYWSICLRLCLCFLFQLGGKFSGEGLRGGYREKIIILVLSLMSSPHQLEAHPVKEIGLCVSEGSHFASGRGERILRRTNVKK